MLKFIFFDLIHSYSEDANLRLELWAEIESNYSNPKRHYHTLSHLESIINQLKPYKEVVSDWDSILFAVFYHDIVYNSLSGDNEEKSAKFAETRLQKLQIDPEKTQHIIRMILATKSHVVNTDFDTNLFIDADLSILGLPWIDYSQYAKQIRKEYSIYPDLIYNPGRKKVLHHFLNMKNIFKTPEFSEKYEQFARKNMQRELREL